VAQQHPALQRHPLPTVLIPVQAKPLLFGASWTRSLVAADAANRDDYMRIILQDQRLQRAQYTVLKDRFHLLLGDLLPDVFHLYLLCT
jgi:hypothetical protein